MDDQARWRRAEALAGAIVSLLGAGLAARAKPLADELAALARERAIARPLIVR
jgi:hypothetical protein